MSVSWLCLFVYLSICLFSICIDKCIDTYRNKVKHRHIERFKYYWFLLLNCERQFCTEVRYFQTLTNIFLYFKRVFKFVSDYLLHLLKNVFQSVISKWTRYNTSQIFSKTIKVHLSFLTVLDFSFLTFFRLFFLWLFFCLFITTRKEPGWYWWQNPLIITVVRIIDFG